MITFIEVIEGASEGSRFKIEQGLTLGRSKADIVIKDPKISSTHAEILINSKEQYVLVDLESSNGLYINGRRVKKVALLPGVIFEVGRTVFKVVQVEATEAANFSRIMTWRTMLAGYLYGLTSPERSESLSLQSFSPALRLSFVQGIQTDEEIILGYGPRSAGSESIDIELLDQDAPKQAFELRPGPGAVEIKILAPGQVTLNKVSVDSEILKDGDLIAVGNTLIKVTYL
jgi:pSer/pThr/pTyr-binding forkhead associated (FHA) protein